MKIKLTIPEPCHENWSNMTPTDKGRHCSVCDKEVLDMTGIPEKEVAEKISKMENGKVCAQIPTSYLDKKIELHAAGWGNYGRMGAAGALITTVALTPTISEPTQDFSELFEKNTWQMTATSIQMNGTVVNEKGEMIPGVKVKVEQNNHMALTSTLANGRFVFHLDPHKITHGKAILKLEKEGFMELEKEINIESGMINGKFVLNSRIELEPAKKIMMMADYHELRQQECIKDVEYREHHSFIEPEYEITRGAVVNIVYMEEIESNPVQLIEEIPEVVVEFENLITLKTYPNPTTDILNLEMSKEGNYTVYVFAMDGKMILNENLNANKMVIDLSNYERGNYIVKVIDNETHESFDSKVVLMR